MRRLKKKKKKKKKKTFIKKIFFFIFYIIYILMIFVNLKILTLTINPDLQRHKQAHLVHSELVIMMTKSVIQSSKKKTLKSVIKIIQ
jgi:uncharacterized membrane protein (DUF485 family)